PHLRLPRARLRTAHADRGPPTRPGPGGDRRPAGDGLPAPGAGGAGGPGDRRAPDGGRRRRAGARHLRPRDAPRPRGAAEAVQEAQPGPRGAGHRRGPRRRPGPLLPRPRPEDGGVISCALAIAALALGAADAKAPALFRPLAFQHRAVPDKVRLGDPLVYELQITHPADQRYELRPPRDLADLELTGTERGRADDQGKAVTTFKLHMAAFALGKQKLPDLVFDVISGDGSSGTFETHGAEVEVVPTISPTAAQNGEPLYDIQPPTEVPVRTWRLLWALAALLAAAALGYAASRFLRRATAAKPEKA